MEIISSYSIYSWFLENCINEIYCKKSTRKHIHSMCMCRFMYGLYLHMF